MTRSPVAAATVSVQSVWLLAAGAGARGLDVPALLAEHGLADAVGLDIDARVDALAVLALWATLPERTGLPQFGVWLAELVCAQPARSLGEKLVHSAPTLGAGLERIIEFERVLHGVQATSLTLVDDVARMTHRPPIGIGAGAAPAIEFAFAWLLGTARVTTGEPLAARAVTFTHAAPADLAPYRVSFGLEPRFASAENTLDLARADLALPQRTADALLARLALRHARECVAELPGDGGLVARARSLLYRDLSRGEASQATLASLAERLGLAARTLQRRFAAENTAFAALLDQVRQEHALTLLAEPKTSVAEVAFVLGFSDQAAFHRAFVRWTGTTPGEHRRRVRVASEVNAN